MLWLIAMLGITHAAGSNLVCYYDAHASLRRSNADLNQTKLELAMQFCTHLVYGYVGLNPDTLEPHSLNVDLDIFHYRDITKLHARFPNLKILLSIGGDRDAVGDGEGNQYLKLLQANRTMQQNFIDSSMIMLRHNGFDGLDLAFQLPKNKPRKVHGSIGSVWKKFKKLFTGDFIVDPQADEHKLQFTELVRNLRNSFQPANLMLTLTVLPNVNSTCKSYTKPYIRNLVELRSIHSLQGISMCPNCIRSWTTSIWPPLIS